MLTCIVLRTKVFNTDQCPNGSILILPLGALASLPARCDKLGFAVSFSRRAGRDASAPRGQYQDAHCSNWFLVGLGFCFLLGCATVPPFSAVNLTDPGWTIHQGQAVWKPKADAPDIAGEILVGTRSNGQTYAQFSKNPFPIVIAQTTTNTWQLELPMRNKRYSGRGNPPKRMIWFAVPKILAGNPSPDDWSVQKNSKSWLLEHKRTGEWVELYL